MDMRLDFELWKDILKNKNAKFVSYRDLNHIFMKSNGLRDINEYSKRGKVSQETIDDISIWVKSMRGEEV